MRFSARAVSALAITAAFTLTGTSAMAAGSAISSLTALLGLGLIALSFAAIRVRKRTV